MSEEEAQAAGSTEEETKDNDSDGSDEESVETHATSSSSGMDWSSLLKMAEEAEAELGEEEVMLPPLEHHIRNLEKGREVAKLASIRALSELIESEGENAIEKMLPAVQSCLRVETANLDVHCEAAVVFKSILQNESLTNKYPGLIEKLLKNVLENVQHQRDNMSAAAWLEILIDIADRISLASVKTFIVPVVQAQAESSQRIQRRIIATKLLHKLTAILPANDVRKDLGACAQMLCQDPNANVRTSMAQRLAAIAKSLNNASDAVSLLLPCLVELVKDDDAGVREAILNTIAGCIPYFTKEAKKNTILPLIKKCTDHALTKSDDSLVIVSRNLGEWAYGLKDVMDALDSSWVLNTYLKIVKMGEAKEGATNKTNTLNTLIRRACSHNYPCLLLMYPNSFDRLLPVLEQFCGDSDDEVRIAIAAAYHEIFLMHPDKACLIPPFIELVRSGATEVVAKITFNLDKILPLMYKCTKQKDAGHRITSQQLDRILIGCNVLLRGCGSWRSHEAYLKNLSVLRQSLTYHQLFDTFVPILQKEILTVRANPCRIAAVHTLLLFMREHPEKAERDKIIKFLKKDVLKHKSCYRRAVFIDVAECAMKIFSREVFKENFLTDTLSLANDEVSNIRIRLSRLLPRLKATIVLPNDDKLLLQVEKTVREMLTREEVPHTRVIVQGAACDLSRADSGKKSDKENDKKKEEEKRLWSEDRLLEKNKMEAKPPMPSGLRPPSASHSVSTSPVPSESTSTHQSRLPHSWRTQRRAVAVVRPQPIVVMRSPSPIPSAADISRKSRLPLSTSSSGSSLSSSSSYSSDRANQYTSSRGLSKLTSRTSSVDAKRTPLGSSMTASTPSYSSYRPSGLQRSSTSSSIGSGSYSSSSSVTSFPLMSSRSMSQIRRPMYGLTKVSSSSAIERKPPQMSMRIRTAT